MEKEDDKLLYQEFLQGKQESFEKIIDKYAEKLIYFIFYFVKNIEVAKDLSQDVFVYLLVNKQNYNFKYELKTYLYIIAKSRAINYLKRESKVVNLSEDYLYHENLLVDIEDVVFKNIKNSEIRSAIFKLAPNQRKSSIFI